VVPDEHHREVASVAAGHRNVPVTRNLAAHGRGREVDREKALDYLTLADATLFAINTWRPKAT